MKIDLFDGKNFAKDYREILYLFRVTFLMRNGIFKTKYHYILILQAFVFKETSFFALEPIS